MDCNANLVGIGTSSPGDSLHSIGTSSRSITIENTQGGGGGNATFKSITTDRNWSSGITGQNKGMYSIRDNTSGASRLIIDTGGNVGVGAVPTQSLDVSNGDINLGRAAVSNGFISSADGIFVNIDGNNDETTKAFTVANNSTGTTGVPLLIVREEGLTYPASRTTAQVIAITPTNAGGMVFNSSLNGLCVSTATTIGAFAVSSDATKSCR